MLHFGEHYDMYLFMFDADRLTNSKPFKIRNIWKSQIYSEYILSECLLLILWLFHNPMNLVIKVSCYISDPSCTFNQILRGLSFGYKNPKIH